MKVLITGGTGFIGSHARDALLARPEMADGQLVRMTRDPRGRRDGDARVTFVAGDVRDAASLERATEGMDAVVHCVQFPNHPVEKPSKGYTYLEIDAKGTERVAAACQKNGVRRIVYLSGAGTSPERPEAWFRAKVIAETAVRDSGIPFVILRPSWIYGPDDKSLNRFVAFARYLPVVPIVGDGTNRVRPIAIFDVATVVAAALFEPDATNRTFDLGGPEDLTMDELVHRVERVLGVRRWHLHQPVALMKLVAWPLSWLPHPPLSPDAVDFMLQESPIDPAPAERTFGFRFMSVDEGLRKYLSVDTRN